MVDPMEFEVRCIGCNELMTPTTTDWDMFRLGVYVHDALPCFREADKKLVFGGGIPMTEVTNA